MEMWIWRKMTVASWIEYKTNEPVLDEVNEKRTLMNKIIKIKPFGYLLRHNEFITIIMEGKINGKRIKGRSRKSAFEVIFRWMGFTSYQQLKRMACDRHEWLKRLGL